MIEIIKRMFCKHKYELVDIWMGTYRDDFGGKMDNCVKKTFFCKKCGKVRKINNL